MLKNERLDTEQRSSLLYEYIVHKEKSDTAYMKGFFPELMELPFDQVEIAELYAQYLIYHKESDDVVIPVVERILQFDPENNAALLQMLKYAIDKNDYEDVIRRCDDALLYMPDMLSLYYYKGLASYLLGDREGIIPVYEQGLQHRSEDDTPEILSGMYSVLGDVYHETGNLRKCIEAYDSALVYDPYNVNVLNNYAYYLSLDGTDLERALEMSAMTLAMEPEEAIYIDTYAWILFKLERYEEAMAYAEKLILLDSDMGAVVCHHCGDIFAMNGDMERAVEMWKRAMELGDDSKVLKKKIKKRKYYPDGKSKRK
jgi:tetratricopeptide (TPR) repeat protein